MPERTPAAKPNRPRNPNSPAKRERPRDELGRPLAWSAQSALRMEDFDSLSLEENHRLGIEHFDAERFFPAHEAWETAWKRAKGTDDAEFFKGLSQLGAGYVHLLRGNAHGALTLFRRGAGRIAAYPVGHRGVNTRALAAAARAGALAVQRARDAGEAIPPLEFPKI